MALKKVWKVLTPASVKQLEDCLNVIENTSGSKVVTILPPLNMAAALIVYYDHIEDEPNAPDKKG